MDCAISMAALIVEKIAKYTVAPVGRQLGYLFCYARNVDNLKNQVQELKHARDRLQHRVEEERNSFQEIEADVLRWMSSVDEISEKAETFLNHEGHAKAVCSCVSLPRVVTRHQLSRKAKKMSFDVGAASQNGKFDGISYRPQLESSFAYSRGYEAFESRREILERIMAAVRDANRSSVGLCGMGGIGKTMLAKEIAKWAEKTELFSKVVMTTISQTPHMKEIQQDIAEKLQLSFGETQSMDVRAGLLRTRLKPENRILLILDDIWKELDLEAIGIHDECKILITSRYRDVLHNSMGIAESNIFFIKAIDSREAISLFRKIVGDIVETADFNSLADKIVEECAGLPIAIATVAYALKGKVFSVWEDALEQLRSSNIRDVEGMDRKVYSCIRMSYDFLGSHDDVKSLLLLCAFHKEDQEIQVEDLMRYSVGWGLLQGINTIKKARNRVNSLVYKLKSHCLLLDGRSEVHVKMHDVVRDVCILIASEEDKHRMNNIKSVEDFVSHERHKASQAISLLEYEDFGKLPEKLECPRAKLLLLSSWSLKSIPDFFFEQTRELEALAMNNARIKSLPSSFHWLQNLQTLCLRNSNLRDIAMIGDLKNLKVLDLSSSSIKRLPKEIGGLCHLQLLDLRDCDSLKVIEPNVISNLTRMEELYMPQLFQGWETEEGGMKGRRNASLIELKNLQRLTTLHLSIQNERVLPEGLFSEQLERYQITIGSIYYFLCGFSKCLYLNLYQRKKLHALGLVRLMKMCEYLSLQRLTDVNNFVRDLDGENFHGLKNLSFCDNDGVQHIIDSTDQSHSHHAFPCLEYLYLQKLTRLEMICHGKLPAGSFKALRDVRVWKCDRLKNLSFCDNDGVQHIIDSTDQSHSHHAFPCLEYLYLQKLTRLEMICHGKLPAGSFKALRDVRVWKCDRLKNLFPLSIVKLLHYIVVSNCEMMEEIVSSGREDNEIESFQLRSLNLDSLPKFAHFYCSKKKATCASSMKDYSKPLFNQTVLFPNLELLIMRRINKEKLWPDQFSSSGSFMPNLTVLNIYSCNSLKYLFSYSLAQKFLNLKKLEVSNCMAMEDIGVTNKKLGQEDTQLENILFPKLDTIELNQLSALQRFFATDSCVEFPLLSKLIIKDCQQLRIFVSFPTIPTSEVSVEHKEENRLVSTQHFFNEKVLLPNLKELKFLKINIVTLWPDQLPTNFDLQNLTSLTVEGCNKIKYLFSFTMVERLINLKMLKVDGCLVVEEILKLSEKRMLRQNILLSKLETLELCGLPVFKTFCSENSCIKEASADDDEVTVITKHPFNGKITFSSVTSYIHNLKELTIKDCNNSTYLLSSGMAGCLVQLERLCISGCEIIEEVIVNEKSAGSKAIIIEKISLPKLESLELRNLPNVRQFCEGDCIECPSLSKLEISNCPKLMKAFIISNSKDTKTCTNNDKKHEETNMVATRQSLFRDKVIFPNLKDLTSDWSEVVKEIFEMSQSSNDNFSKLDLTNSSRDKPIALSNFNFLKKYHKIDTLKLSGFFVDGHEDVESYELVNTSVKTLHIVKVHMLKHLFGGLEYAQPSNTFFFQNLKHLKVWKCGRLHSFAMSLMSFHKLKTLEVSECHGLTNLFASSTAASLVHLDEMSVTNCKQMREIINRDYYEEGQIGGSENNGFVFQRLERLTLRNLPSLECFYSGNKDMSFPNLEELSLKGCPEMRRFSHGDISTSALLNTIEAEGEHVWERDVNTTLTKFWEGSDLGLHLQHLFAQEMDDQHGEEDA